MDYFLVGNFKVPITLWNFTSNSVKIWINPISIQSFIQISSYIKFLILNDDDDGSNKITNSK